MTDRIRRIADDLIGTTQSLGDACESEGCTQDDLTRNELHLLDTLAFECEQCNWWCGDDEASETDGVCIDCFEQDE